MDHAGTMRRLYDLLNVGDVDGFGALLADDFRAREHWGVFDSMTMMQQLGVVPAGAPA